MTFSSTVAQQRQKQAITLQRFITYSLAGSLTLHGLGLFLKVAQPAVNEEITPEEITIVVTEPPEELPPEETEIVPDPQAPAVATAPPAATTQATTVVETPVETAPPEEPVVEEPEPLPSPVADVPVEEEVVEDVPEAVTEEPTETIAATPPRRNLRDLLNDLRQSEETTNPVADAPAPDASPARGPRGFVPSQFSRPGTAEGVTTAAGPTTSGTGTSPTPSAPQGEGDRPASGSSFREISCRGCDFDYPEEADGAEGQAQVVVETDEQGRVISVTLSRSSGNAALDRAALQQARERVRLNNARAGESYPLEIDFVQPNSDAARRAQERGDRRSITVNDPEPEVPESPTAATGPDGRTAPTEEDAILPTPELPLTSPQPSSTPGLDQDEEDSLEPDIESATPAIIPSPEGSEPSPSAPSSSPDAAPPPSLVQPERPSPSATRSPEPTPPVNPPSNPEPARPTAPPPTADAAPPRPAPPPARPVAPPTTNRPAPEPARPVTPPPSVNPDSPPETSPEGSAD